MKHSRLAIISLSLLALAACGGSTESAATDATTPPPVDASTELITADRTNRDAVAAAILESFARQDWQTLSTFVAPTGMRFAPYTHVDLENDLTFSPNDIAGFGSDTTQKTWGTTEGSGEPIVMTNIEYAARYVWDHDYRTAPDVYWNQQQTHGSIIDNVQDVFPGITTAEYHFPGFDDQYGGMDWRSLRLLLAQGDDGTWSLHGIIHDEWTP